MGKINSLKKQIEEEKSKLISKKRKYTSNLTEVRLKKELASLKLQNKVYPVTRTLKEVGSNLRKVGNEFGKNVERLKKQQEEKQKGGLGFLKR